MLNGKVVLITGAAHGIGLETARAFAREGARLALADRHQERLSEAVAELEEAGFEAVGMKVDLRGRENVCEMVDSAASRLGPVDVLVNNAGVVFAKRLEELTDSEISDTFEVNLLAPVWATRRVIPQMRERGAGHIVNVGSVAGKITNRNLSVYAASKAGLIGFTDTMLQELRDGGIRTTVVNPGLVSSGMFSGARLIPLFMKWTEPRQVAEAIVTAVKTGRAEVHCPAMIWVGGLLRALLGPKLIAGLWKLLGADDHFAEVKGYEQCQR